MTINIFHAAFGDNGFVASINVDESDDVIGMLEAAYHYSQNINESWIKGSRVTPNEAVADREGIRSTSMDDYMEIAGAWYKVSAFGFEKVDLKNEIIERRITAKYQLGALIDYYDNGDRRFVGEPLSLAIARYHRDGYTQGR